MNAVVLAAALTLGQSFEVRPGFVVERAALPAMPKAEPKAPVKVEQWHPYVTEREPRSGRIIRVVPRPLRRSR